MPLGEKTNNKNLFFLRDSKKTKNSPLFTFKKGEGQSFTVGISVNTKRQVHPSRREGRTATLKQHATCRSCRHSSWTWECISNVNQWITCCSGTGCRKVLDVPAASQAWKERNDQKSHLQLQLPPAKSACCSPLSQLSRQKVRRGKAQHSQKSWLLLNGDVSVCTCIQNSFWFKHPRTRIANTS